jgi:hypothetical protein
MDQSTNARAGQTERDDMGSMLPNSQMQQGGSPTHTEATWLPGAGLYEHVRL